MLLSHTLHRHSQAEPIADVLIIGGGINGAGIACDAAGRGLSVILCEQQDFASATSSASSKLIHGGLRYLEHGALRLVKEALREREILLANAPHLTTPMRFRLPYRAHLRPKWQIQLGLMMYDRLAKRATLPASERLDLRHDPALSVAICDGFAYSDVWVDDARLVLANVQAAAELGAEMRNYSQVTSAQFIQDASSPHWQIALQNTLTGERTVRSARVLVNAAGPWANKVLTGVCQQQTQQKLRLVQGSHLVVPKLYEGEHAYILQHNDGRIVFVIPYLEHFSMIGTTDLELDVLPNRIEMTQTEADYLLEVVNHYFRRTITPNEIVHHFAGIRPLADGENGHAQQASRDYQLSLSPPNKPALLTIYGGKLTTYRKLAEQAVNQIAPFFSDIGEAWTQNASLPGGKLPRMGDAKKTRHQYLTQLMLRYPFLAPALLKRYVNQYGDRCEQLLKNVSRIELMGAEIAPDVFERELEYLIEHEWVKTAQDALERRTKLHLQLSAEQRQTVQQWLTARQATQENLGLNCIKSTGMLNPNRE